MKCFNIQTTSQLSGVSATTIRAWEKRYQAVSPLRDDNQHRLYTEEDVEKLSLLFRLKEIGQSIGKIAPLSLGELQELYRSLELLNETTQGAQAKSSGAHTKEILQALFLSLTAYKVDVLAHELEKAQYQLGLREFCLGIVVPFFHEIGLRVSRGELTIAQEHTVSALTSFHLGQLIGAHYKKSSQRQELVLIATPENEHHSIGILAATLLCIYYGHKIIFLGTNMPAPALSIAANSLKCHAILLGVSRAELAADKDLFQYVDELQLELKDAQIWIGGGGLVASDRTSLAKQKVRYFSSLNELDLFLAKR